jgi:hypothetical protein
MEQHWMSLRAYARHRGVALSAVQKAIESRRVTAIREEGNRITGIEKNQADEQWAKNTDPVEAARNGKLELTPPAAAQQTEKPAAPAEQKPAADGDAAEYLAARAKREGFLAKQAELDYLEQIGKLVSTAEVEREFSEIFSQLKNSVFRIADSKAQILAAETDPARVNRQLSDAFRTVFDELSNRFASEAAGGASERAAALP